MKRLLLSMLLFTLCLGARAQVGSLRLVNTSTCDVYLSMSATDIGAGDPFPCNIQSCWVVVPAGTTLFFATPYDFATSPLAGFCSLFVNPGIAYWLTTSTFLWTDVSFQYGCPDCSGGSRMTDASIVPASTCYAAPAVYAGPCSHLANWLPDAGSLMTNVTIKF